MAWRIALSTVALVSGLGAASADAPPRPPARGLVAEVAVRAWQLRAYHGGPQTMRGTSVAVAAGVAIAPALIIAIEYELAQPGDETKGLQAVSGAITYRLAPGARLTAELVTARLHFGQRSDHTGLGAGGRVGYELPAGNAVAVHADLGVRWLATLEDDGSDDAPAVPGVAVGVGVTWY